MFDLYTHFKENKPNLTDKSITNYSNNLIKIFEHTASNMDKFSLSFFINNTDRIIEYIESIKSLSSRKTFYASIVSLLSVRQKDSKILDAIDKYRSIMNGLIRTYNENIKNQHKSRKENEKWIEWNKVLKTHTKLWQEVNTLFTKKNPTEDNIFKLQRFVVLSLFVLNPPRRIMDYVDFKIKNIDEKTDNYMDEKRKVFVFNSFKNSNTKGQQIVEINPNLFAIMKQWKKIQLNRGSEWLINPKGRTTKASNLNFRTILSGCFDSKLGISVNILRHSYLTWLFGDQPSLREKEKLAEQMGHSIEHQELYRRID